MRHRPTRLPRPATVISLVALSAALGGSAYAVGRIDGKSLRDRSVSGKKLRVNTVTGREIRERTLGRVRRAARADTATLAGRALVADSALRVGGAAIVPFRFAAPAGTAETVVAEAGGLRLLAACDGAALLSATARTAVDDSSMYLALNTKLNGTAAHMTQRENFDVADTFAITADAADEAQGTLTYVQPGDQGSTVTGTFALSSGATALGGLAGCLMAGTLTVASR